MSNSVETSVGVKPDSRHGGLHATDSPARHGGLTDSPAAKADLSTDSPAAKANLSRATWKSACLDFVDSTTLHGIRFVFLEHASLVRRLLWLGILLACAGLMVYQIAERVQYFLRRPVAVNLEINYNFSLPFPALTVCNQNSFRASVVWDEDWFQMITDFVEGRGAKGKLENLTVDEMFRRTAHRKENFIQGCKWGGEDCSPENFTQVFTDHGLCFTFNHDRHNPLQVKFTGSGHGLRLVLNVESYEDMVGPHESLGVKLLVHDPRDVAMVEALGLAVPPGSHAFVGVQLQVVDNLPPPHGECGSQPSEFFPPDRHTVDSCQLSCLTSQLRQACGCRHHFMPHVNGSPPVCTLTQLHQCYQRKIAKLTVAASRSCLCPVPCRSSLYDPVISVASLASKAVGNYLFSSGLFDSMDDILIRKGKSDAFNSVHRYEVYQISDQVITSYFTLKSYVAKVSSDFDSSQDARLGGEEGEFFQVMSTRLHFLRWQDFHLDKNFLRVWREMEGTLGFMLDNPWHFTKQLAAELSTLNASSGQDAAILQAILSKEVRNSLAFLTAAQGDYFILHSSFRSGRSLYKDRYDNYTEEDNEHVAPKQLLWRGQVTEEELYLPTRCLENASVALERWLAMLSDIRENHTLNDTLVGDLRNQFIASIVNFSQGVMVVHSKVFQPPKDVISSEIQTAQSLEPAMRQHFREHKQHLRAISKLHDKMRDVTFPALDDFFGHIDNYVRHRNKTTKVDLARLFLENVGHMDDFQSYFRDVAAKVEAVQNNLNKLQSQMENLWEGVWADRTELRGAYAHFNYTELLVDRDDKLRTLTAAFDRSRDVFRAMGGLGPEEKNFNDGLQSLADLMADFVSKPKLLESYLQNNIVKVDVYFRERKYEHVTQQIAYDEFALLSDIGGSVGLFAGASVLTLFELLDLILHQILYRVTHDVIA